MFKKTYTLELTAEELEQQKISTMSPVDQKLSALRAQARADQAAADLRLPWRAVCCGEWLDGAGQLRSSWMVHHNNGSSPWSGLASKQSALLMSAAPELLEAVKGVRRWVNEMVEVGTMQEAEFRLQVKPLIERALRKVETGCPSDLPLY